MIKNSEGNQIIDSHSLSSHLRFLIAFTAKFIKVCLKKFIPEALEFCLIWLLPGEASGSFSLISVDLDHAKFHKARSFFCM